MAYFQPYIDDTGLHLPTYQDRLDDLIAAYQSIFSAGDALTPATPDYQFLSLIAKALDDAGALALMAYNSRSPYYAQGQSLDLLAQIYGLTRIGATASTVTLTLTGTAGATIPAGSVAADAAGYLWETDEDALIGGGGTVDVTATCQTTGEIFAAANTITQVVSSVAGWTGVNNAAMSTIGLATETDAKLRSRIANAFPLRGSSSVDAVAAALWAVPNARAVRVYANDTGSTDARGIPAHSIAPVILGGGASDIGKAIYDNKAPGIDTYGSVASPYTPPDETSSTIYFSRPTSKKMSLSLQVSSLSSDFNLSAISSRVKPVLVSYLEKLNIGIGVSISELIAVCYSACTDLAGSFYIYQLSGSVAGVAVTDRYAADWREWLYTTDGDIQVVEHV